MNLDQIIAEAVALERFHLPWTTLAWAPVDRCSPYSGHYWGGDPDIRLDARTMRFTWDDACVKPESRCPSRFAASISGGRMIPRFGAPTYLVARIRWLSPAGPIVETADRAKYLLAHRAFHAVDGTPATYQVGGYCRRQLLETLLSSVEWDTVDNGLFSHLGYRWALSTAMERLDTWVCDRTVDLAEVPGVSLGGAWTVAAWPGAVPRLQVRCTPLFLIDADENMAIDESIDMYMIKRHAPEVSDWDDLSADFYRGRCLTSTWVRGQFPGRYVWFRDIDGHEARHVAGRHKYGAVYLVTMEAYNAGKNG